MGISVGLPLLKLANSPSSKSSRRRTGTLRSIACEALEERWGRDPDIDKSKTRLNEYEGITSGLALTARLTEMAADYSEQRKAAGGRSLRSDAAIGFVLLVKPDKDSLSTMSEDEKQRFFQDSDKVLYALLGKAPLAGVLQKDEIAYHQHKFYDGFTDDGRLCVDELVNPKMFKKINGNYAAKMRELGWDVQDCEMYDEARAKADPDYYQERIIKHKSSGRGSRKYKADREKALDEREAALKIQEQQLAEQQAKVELTMQQMAAGLAAAKKQQKELDIRAEALEADKRAWAAQKQVFEVRYNSMLDEARTAKEDAQRERSEAEQLKQDAKVIKEQAESDAQQYAGLVEFCRNKPYCQPALKKDGSPCVRLMKRKVPGSIRVEEYEQPLAYVTGNTILQQYQKSSRRQGQAAVDLDVARRQQMVKGRELGD